MVSAYLKLNILERDNEFIVLDDSNIPGMPENLQTKIYGAFSLDKEWSEMHRRYEYSWENRGKIINECLLDFVSEVQRYGIGSFEVEIIHHLWADGSWSLK